MTFCDVYDFFPCLNCACIGMSTYHSFNSLPLPLPSPPLSPFLLSVTRSDSRPLGASDASRRLADKMSDQLPPQIDLVPISCTWALQ